jgi:uncharacterized membrane protein
MADLYSNRIGPQPDSRTDRGATTMTGTISGNAPESYALLLKPHRSLSPEGFVVLMVLVAVISFIGGLVFFLVGAWPVTGFLGLDVLAIYFAFKLNYVSGRWQELIEISGAEMRVCRTSPWGKQSTWHFNPYWVRVETRFEDDECTEMVLTSHGRRLRIGAFLGNEMRAEAAQSLRAALRLGSR